MTRFLHPLYNHNSPETAFVVDDYPYGFRLRCKIRYWIEFKEKQGFRFCSQTTNPKFSCEHWNKPKKSTYSLITMGMYEINDPEADDHRHVGHRSLTQYSDLKDSISFKEKWGFCLSEFAANELDTWIKAKTLWEEKLRDKVFKATIVESEPVPLMSLIGK